MGGNAPSRLKTTDTAVTEVYFKGVSAGVAEGIMAELGIGDLTPPNASRIVKELGGQLEAWWTRPLGETVAVLRRSLREGTHLRRGAVMLISSLGEQRQDLAVMTRVTVLGDRTAVVSECRSLVSSGSSAEQLRSASQQTATVAWSTSWVRSEISCSLAL